MNELEIKADSKNNGSTTQVEDSLQHGLQHGMASADLSLRLFRDEAEIRAISSALTRTGWNRKRAAQLLSISYRGLLYKIRRHNIAPPGELS
jgi:transcriptional regulator with GAF, ATPase, and Fis domain